MKDLPIHPDHFGGCPICGDGYRINIGEDNYAVCDLHMMAWGIGESDYVRWKSNDEEVWRKNEELLGKCEPVEPRWAQLAIDELHPKRP